MEALYAGQPRVIIDNIGPGEEKWRLNAQGTYDIWYGDEVPSIMSLGYTREEISEEFGIKEERY